MTCTARRKQPHFNWNIERLTYHKRELWRSPTLPIYWQSGYYAIFKKAVTNADPIDFRLRQIARKSSTGKMAVQGLRDLTNSVKMAQSPQSLHDETSSELSSS